MVSCFVLFCCAAEWWDDKVCGGMKCRREMQGFALCCYGLATRFALPCGGVFRDGFENWAETTCVAVEKWCVAMWNELASRNEVRCDVTDRGELPSRSGAW